MELTANELRIGNLFDHFEDGVLPIEEIKKDSDGFDGYYAVFRNNSIKCRIDFLDPIPLTEEWLLKFGFEKDKYDYFHHIKSKIIIGHTTTDEFFEYEYLTGFQDSQTEMCELKYIHQLQNLYFALNCQELKLK